MHIGAGYYHAVYEERDAFCDMKFGDSANITALSGKVDVVGKCVTYAGPVIVVMISCFICVANLKHSVQSCANNIPHIAKMKQKATVTILIFTGVFLILNIPELVNTILWFIVVRKYGYWPGPVDLFHPVVYYYFRNFTNVLCWAINATANPIVLFWRMQRYQQWVKRETHGFVSYGGKMATGLNSTVQGELKHLHINMAGITSSQVRSASRDKICSNEVVQVKSDKSCEDTGEKSSEECHDETELEQAATVSSDCCITLANDSVILVSTL